MNRRKQLLRGSAAIVATLPCLAAGAAWAQQGEDADRSSTIEEIVVTPLNQTHTVNVGAFGAKDPLDIPISIQSHGQLEIENIRARTVVEILRNDPSVQESSIGGAYDNLRIRGFAVDWSNTLRVDGMSVAPYQDIPFENVERVDLLKGPSGFLYGFNSPGGTVNYIIKRPTAQPFFRVTGEVVEHDGWYAHIDTSAAHGPDDVIGYRLNLAYEEVGDFTNAGDLQRHVGALNVDLRLAENLILQLNTDFQSKDVAAQPLIGLQSNGALPPKVNPRTLLGFPWLQYKTDAYDIGGRLDYTLNDDWFFVLQANYSVNDRDGAFVDIYEVAANGDILDGDFIIAEGQGYETTSAQAFASGKFATGPISHEFVAGLALRNYDARQSGYYFEPLTVGNILRPVYPPASILPPPLPKAKIKNRQYSAFVSDFITLNDQWQVLVGLRYIDYYNRNWPARAAAPRTPYEKNSWVPSAALMFKPTPDITAYVSYAKGLEEGGTAPITTVNAGESLDPIESTQYEAGLKARVSGVTLAAAVFEIEKGLEYTNAQRVYVQEGRQRHRGVELSASGEPIEGLNVVGGVAWLDAKQVRTNDPTTQGKDTVDAPEWQANVNFDYRLPFADGLYANAGVYYVGKRALDAQNTAFAPSYTRVDAGIRYTFEVAEREITVRAHVKNLFDKFYWQVGQEYTSVIPGAPRTWHLSASVLF